MNQDTLPSADYPVAMNAEHAAAAASPAHTTRILMCVPTHFGVEYVINPWMQGQTGNADVSHAQRQWDGLTAAIGRVAEVELVAPIAGLPDMVFTANAGMIWDDAFVPSRFRHAERQGEEAHFIAWFRERGFRIVELPEDLEFEGAGDALYDRAVSNRLWMGHGHRSDLGVAAELEKRLPVQVLPLRLSDERFYHLDTCFCPLEGGWLLYFPGAFDAAANALIEANVPAHKRIAIDESDAVHFACNAVNVGDTIILNRAGDSLKARLHAAGFRVLETPLDEFLKAGGSAKCLTLRLQEPPRP